MAKDKDDQPIPARKRVVFLHGEIKTPPFSHEARKETGDLLGQFQQANGRRTP